MSDEMSITSIVIVLADHIISNNIFTAIKDKRLKNPGPRIRMKAGAESGSI